MPKLTKQTKAQMMMTGVMWRHAKQDPPKDDKTVLMFRPESYEPVVTGYFSRNCWCRNDGSLCTTPPLLWAKLPHPDDGKINAK